MNLDTLLPLWRANLAVDHAESTVRSYTDHVVDFLSQLGDDPTVAHITAPAIELFKVRLKRRCNAKTIGLALTSVRSFVRWQIRSELRTDDPTLLVTFPRPGKSLPRALADEHVRELLTAIVMPDGLSPGPAYQWRRNSLAIYLMLYAGLRISEVGDLRCRDVLLAQGKIIVRNAKGDKDRSIPIHVVPLGYLRLAVAGRRPHDAVCGHPTGEALAEGSLHHVFERWVPRLGLSFEFTPHQLRHTCLTKLIDTGANIFEAQEVAGHESPETTRIYYRLSAEHLRAAVDRLPVNW
jgi:site-specific recombinase XerD